MTTIEHVKPIRSVGVLTSGGDAPGMNAAIRAVVRAGLAAGLDVYGIKDGFLGLHQERILKLDYNSVTDIIGLGGTILGTARFEAFKEDSVRKEAAHVLKKRGIDSLVVIGGDGSYMGALRLSELGIPCIGVPGTIDNDVYGTDYTIGFETALNTVVECMDRLIDTCNSHKRVSVVEIMGRHCGDLAMHASVASAADFVIIPEVDFDKEAMFKHITKSFNSGKRHGLVAVCENIVNIDVLTHEIETATGIECRSIVLGHLQRGGKPTPNDRILGSRLGTLAIDLLLQGCSGECVGIQDNALVHSPIGENGTHKHRFDITLSNLASRLV